ncbi:uncharacterized protein APUU_12023S [Aspergillus puulaauensis]|uniref:Major facilitator superfamily (MFS) profile domain-containing protein n=1 Tax=Aspergillus puulaauensis TaxID=1220207 RepID=A0A7R8AJ15_9EURO|nr:uncharacterized protein APUU_12023S [Aspergillus puulaauensis]BCS19195.1 hypothetical protein APUU_12023S [Aspergillus puulaauensis]
MAVNGISFQEEDEDYEHPLLSRTPEELVFDATLFYDRQNHKKVKGQKLENVVDKEVFLRGARLAQNPNNRLGIPGLTNVEKDALKSERESGLFKQTKDLKVTILVTACAAITQGWQQSSINASSLHWQSELRPIPGNKYNLFGGFIDAAPWLTGSLIGTWLSDPLQEGQFGRRPALFISGICCTAFALGTARCNNWQELLICRLLLGIGIGAKASVAPVFAAEAAVDHLRGRLLMMWQLFDTFGIFVGFVCVFIAQQHWRVILGSAAIPSIILLFLAFLCPESPRFLIRKKRYADAFLSLRHLRGSDIQACRDLYSIHSQLQFESQKRLRRSHKLRGDEWLRKELYQEVELSSLNFFKRVRSLWSIKRNRRACIAAFIVMASQQLCGINVLSFYSSVLFSQVEEGEALVNNAKVDWLNFGFGLANFLFTIPAHRYIDGYHKKGRRLLLLVSLAGMFFSLIAISSFYLIESPAPRTGLVAVFTIVVYLAFYGIGAGPVPFTFSAEVFPLAFREVGMSFSVMVNFIGLTILVSLVPLVNKYAVGTKEKNPYAYLLYIFAGLDALAFVLVFLFVPSTGQIPLEQMDQIFEKHTCTHIKEHFAALPCVHHSEDGAPDEESNQMHTIT